jgi:hypothetical protein
MSTDPEIVDCAAAQVQQYHPDGGINNVESLAGRELERLLPYGDAVGALRAPFSETRADAPDRVRVDVPGGELLLMPAFGSEGVGVKLRRSAWLGSEPYGWWYSAPVAGDLTDLARGAVTRVNPEQITVFKSMGIADEDLVVVRLIARRLAAPAGSS